MSMYNLIHGENSYATVLLAILGLTRSDIPRYRDCYWTGSQVAIHTRTGGGNRDYYESLEECMANYPEYFNDKDDAEKPSGPWNDDLRLLPTFLYDEDDDFDPTYATFYFSIPEQFAWTIPHLQTENMTPAEKWLTFMDKLRDSKASDDPQVKRTMEAMKPIFEQIITTFKQNEVGN